METKSPEFHCMKDVFTSNIISSLSMCFGICPTYSVKLILGPIFNARANQHNDIDFDDYVVLMFQK